MAYEDFYTFTELDPYNAIQVTSATRIDSDFTRYYDMWRYKDYGAAHFGDFTHMIHMRMPYSMNSGRMGTFWALSNTIDDCAYWYNNHINSCWLEFVRGNPYFRLRAQVGSSLNADISATATYAAYYYFTITRSGSTLTCQIYTDSARTVLFDTLSITCSADTFRYLFVVNSWNDGTAATTYADIFNLDIGESGGLVASSQII